MKLKLRNVFKVDVSCLFVRTFLSEKCVFLFSHRADFIKSEEAQMKKIAVIGAVLEAVSYTHLDVYKRQIVFIIYSLLSNISIMLCCVPWDMAAARA